MPRKKSSKDQALLTCLQHPLRRLLLVLYVEAKDKRSPKELADVTAEHLSKVSYHVRVLTENKAVRLVATSLGADRSSTSTDQRRSLIGCPGGGKRWASLVLSRPRGRALRGVGGLRVRAAGCWRPGSRPSGCRSDPDPDDPVRRDRAAGPQAEDGVGGDPGRSR